MSNLDIYNSVRVVPKEAQKAIAGGRLKGKTDINPMWRIKALTEAFGPCGIGWKYIITKQWMEAGYNGEVAAFCNIDLYIKVDGQWSDAIPGHGGNMFVQNEKNGMYTSDECFKMALTDAISVACKALGFGADIYWADDKTKYDTAASRTNAKPAPAPVDDQLAIAIDELRRCKSRREISTAHRTWSPIYGDNEKYNAELEAACLRYPKQ